MVMDLSNPIVLVIGIIILVLTSFVWLPVVGFLIVFGWLPISFFGIIALIIYGFVKVWRLFRTTTVIKFIIFVIIIPLTLYFLFNSFGNTHPLSKENDEEALTTTAS